ncbi:MAG: class I SAM-dependent methyltransferase [Xanthobacteraceae bacterium]
MDWLLRIALRSIIKQGNLRVTTANGATIEAGDGHGELVSVRFMTAAAQVAVLLDPELKVGETYTDGTLVIERGSIADFLAIAMPPPSVATLPHWMSPHRAIRFLMRRLAQFNWRGRSRANVSHHYDLDARLYSLFLDSDRQYSCGYFETPKSTLDDAQLAKKRHLAAKLLANAGQRVLDIGCGWGGLALYIARFCGAKVTGITLSSEQLAIAKSRAQEQRLDSDAEFRIQDYRDVAGPFDRIISVGMFEHVGVGYYDAFFRQCRNILADEGVMVLHSIGRSEGPTATNAWIAKYIFPGGYIPALSEVLPAIERAGLLLTDIEILRLHYAETLKAWRERFLAHREEVERLYDSRFVRMWEFYLAGSEMSFRQQNLMVFQLQITKRQGIVPITRDYIVATEAQLRGQEARERVPVRLAGE